MNTIENFESDENVKVDSLTLEEKVSLFAGANHWNTMEVARLNIESLCFSDGPTGVRSSDGNASTVFPVGTAIAATWNPELIEKMAASLGREARAMGVNVLLAPMVNIQRSPLAGRNFETYSEDPYLTGCIGSAFVNGLQSEGVGASLKHFVANNQETNRHHVDALISERALREIYLAPFEQIVKEANPWTIMTAYNKVNGHFMTANSKLLLEILKGEWGYDGLVMSDWGATHSTEAARLGLDLEMPGPAIHMGQRLLQAVKDGEISEAVIDDGAARLLRLVRRCNDTTKSTQERFSRADQRKHARSVAEQAITLLKNDAGILPLDRSKLKSIAVIGPNADAVIIQGGGSSHVVPAHKETIYEAIKNYLADSNITVFHSQGTDNEIIPPGADYRLFSPTSESLERGLKVEYFKNNEPDVPYSSAMDTHFEKVGFGATLYDETKGQFNILWSGVLKAPTTGTYEIQMIQTGQTTLSIANKVLASPEMDTEYLNLAGIIPGNIQIATIDLEEGCSYPIEMRYIPAKTPFQFLRFGLRVPNDEMEEAIKLARKVDAVVLVAGVSTTSDQEGTDRENILLQGRQNELISRVLEANPNTVVVLNAAGPVEMPWLGDTSALLNAWLPGQEGAAAVTDILFGECNPSGKLPMTFPRQLLDNPSHTSFPGDHESHYEEGVFVGYRHYDTNNIDPLFPFGHGLSYTEFTYISVNGDALIGLENPLANIKVVLRNDGTVGGHETVQVYVSKISSSQSRPIQELKGFKKVYLEAEEGTLLSFDLNGRSFSYWDTDARQWAIEPGEYMIYIGSSSRDIKLRHKLTVS
ncbi:MAG: beta-glucosidase [Robiginitomaculum sp.]|nr:MAG: beta-glucosidase [Robiginitomaculum sp.]